MRCSFPYKRLQGALQHFRSSHILIWASSIPPGEPHIIFVSRRSSSQYYTFKGFTYFRRICGTKVIIWRYNVCVVDLLVQLTNIVFVEGKLFILKICFNNCYQRYPLPRTIWDGEHTIYCFKEKSRNVLKTSYTRNRYPSQEERRRLAELTGLSMGKNPRWLILKPVETQSCSVGSELLPGW